MGSHVDNVSVVDEKEKDYKVSLSKEIQPLDDNKLTFLAKEMLRNAVIEDNSNIINRSKYVPLNIVTFSVRADDKEMDRVYQSKAETINAIGDALGITFTPSSENFISKNIDLNNGTAKLSYTASLTETNPILDPSNLAIKKLYEHGIPKIIYEKNTSTPDAGAPTRDIRLAAIKEAISKARGADCPD